MLVYLAQYEHIWGPLRVFKYLTFRCLMAWITALIIGFIVAPWILKQLRKLKATQAFRDESQVGKLADLHAGKKDVPTMGGLIIYVSMMLTSFLWCALDVVYVWVAWIVYTILTCVGFADDYLKVTRKNTKGLSSTWKWLIQGLLAFSVLLILLTNPETYASAMELWVPFYKHPVINEMAPWFAFLFFFVVMCGSSNAINLTDGVDGLAIGCTIIVSLTFAVIAYAAGHALIANYLLISFVPGIGELAVMCVALAGAGLVFLWYNAHPAEVFMGDTGSLALGGFVGTVAFLVHQPLTLIVIGGVFVMEALSVILQVGSYKLRGKRIFRMSPIHHHFELKGWHENKVVIRFWILSLMFALIGLSSLKLR